MEDRLPVYIITTGRRGPGTQNVSRLFQDPMFNVIVPELPTEQRTEFLAKLGQANALEATQILGVLSLSYAAAPDKPVIILKDNSVSHLTPEQITNRVKSILALTQPFDIFYLCKWNDRCQLYTNKRNMADTNTFLAQTQAPGGFQAVLITPSGRDIILGQAMMPNNKKFKLDHPLPDQLTHEIFNGHLVAFTETPNIIDFDIRYAMSNADYVKLNECQPVKQSSQNVGSSTAAYVWFFIVILAIFLLAWALIRIGPGTRN